MPQFDFSTIYSQVFWLVITFSVLYVAMSRWILPRIEDVLEERQDRIDNDMDKAIELKAEAELVMGDYEEALRTARLQARHLLEEATVDIKQFVQEKQHALSDRLTADTAKAEKRIKSATIKAMDDVKSVARDVAKSACNKLIGITVPDKQADSAVNQAIKEAA